MLALRLVRLIETESDKIARSLVAKILCSPHTREMRKFPEPELLAGTEELLQHLSDWLLNKTSMEIEVRYRAFGARLASEDVALADCCWGIIITKEFLWDFLQKQGFLRGPIELYGEMELLCLLEQFFDHALCYCVEGYEGERKLAEPRRPSSKPYRALNLAAFVP
ncbi:MAG: hypothetical protein JO159_18175 [Acidobacteria bacterium]|nr:hypothetical protein [Acidobacteriota bacterium]